jgi:peroxiredoxin
MGRIGYLFYIFLLLCICQVSTSQNVTLYGKAPSYANREIVFYSYSDMISGEKQEIGRSLVDIDGDFSVSFNLEETTFVFSHLGIYKAFLYAEPGNKYEIILPERTEKSPEDELNPFYVESRIQLGTTNINPGELNFLIRMFNDAYTPYYNKHLSNFINKNDFSELDNDIENMEKPFVNSTNKYFNDYRDYRYGLLKFLANQKKAASTHKVYFKNRPVLYNNPAYMELFNQVYYKYFIFHGKSHEGKKIFNALNISGSYMDLKNAFSGNEIFSNDTILELVILKQIFNEFYDDNFYRSSLLNILDTLMLKTEINKHKLIAKTIKNKITKLLPGYVPPAFSLYDADSNLVTLDDSKERYVYLNFCMCYSYTCMSEFKLLENIYERHKEHLEIVTIIVDHDKKLAKEFLDKNNYKWKFLYYGNQPDILKEYDIRAYPTYFLIDPDGKLILSPSPSPAENFESNLVKTMRARGDL